MLRHLRLLFLLAQLARLSLAEGTAGAPGPAGGSGSTEGGTGGTGSTDGGTGAGTGSTGATGDPAAGDPPKATSEKLEDQPEWVQRIVREARQDAAKHRTAAKGADQTRTELLKGLAKTLGVDVDGTPPDPAQLQAQIAALTGERDQATAATRARDVELAAWRAAGKHGADVSALMDSRSFVDQVAKLDPAGDKFGEQLDAAIKAAVAANPKLRSTGQAPGRGGADFSGGTGGDAPATSLEDAYTKRLTKPKT